MRNLMIVLGVGFCSMAAWAAQPFVTVPSGLAAGDDAPIVAGNLNPGERVWLDVSADNGPYQQWQLVVDESGALAATIPAVGEGQHLLRIYSEQGAPLAEARLIAVPR